MMSRRVGRVDVRGVAVTVAVTAAVAVGAVAGLTLWPGSSVACLWVVVEPEPEPVDSSSAAAIAPPALPMRRPDVSTQIPAARRRCVVIVVSSHQHAIWGGRLIDRHSRTAYVNSHPDSGMYLRTYNWRQSTSAGASKMPAACGIPFLQIKSRLS